MLLIPYFKESTRDWLTLGLFLCEGGRSIWSVEDGTSDKEIKKLLKENGFPVLSLTHEGNTVYAAINRGTLKMSDFYEWTDLKDPRTAEQDVWRTLQIPLALWSCPVFKEHFWNSAAIPCGNWSKGLAIYSI